MFVEPGGVAIEKSVPIPVRAIACGAPGALSAMVMAPLRVPVAVGVKVMVMAPARVPMAVGAKLTLIVQLAFAATLPPFAQVVPGAGTKSPLETTLVMVNVALPMLVSVTVLGALIEPSGCRSKVRLRGDSMTAGPVLTALPVRLIIWGLSAALSVMLIVPVKRPG